MCPYLPLFEDNTWECGVIPYNVYVFSIWKSHRQTLDRKRVVYTESLNAVVGHVFSYVENRNKIFSPQHNHYTA